MYGIYIISDRIFSLSPVHHIGYIVTIDLKKTIPNIVCLKQELKIDATISILFYSVPFIMATMLLFTFNQEILTPTQAGNDTGKMNK